jgi:hypothetical protein
MERDEAVKRAEKAEAEVASLRKVLGWSHHNGPCSEVSIHAAMVAAQRDAIDLRARLDEAVGLLRRFASADAMHEAPWNDNTAFLAKHDAREGGKC